MQIAQAILQFWRRLSFLQQFHVLVVLCALPALLGLGSLLQSYFSHVAVKNTATAIAMTLDNDISPFAQEIAAGMPLKPERLAALNRLMNTGRHGQQILSIKVWNLDGVLLYATQSDLIGKKFEMADELQVVSKGEIVGRLEEPEPENASELQLGLPLLEVYAPVQGEKSQEFVAIAEIYLNGTELKNSINAATRDIWLISAFSTFLVLTLLSLVVQQASKTIVQQNADLDQKVAQLSQQLGTNEKLWRDLRAAHQRFAHITEQTLRQAGSNLHDGPVQVLASLALRFPKLAQYLKRDDAGKKLHAELGGLATMAMKDLRQVASGLVLPQFEGMKLHEVIEMAIHDHEARTHYPVSRGFDPCTDDCPEVVKVTAFRIVQESLTNAVKHADGKGLRVEFTCTPDIDIRIMDRGKGISGQYSHSSLGLRGMQARMEALGGKLTFELREGGGTVVCAHLEAKRIPELSAPLV